MTLVLSAALIHATWNLLVKKSGGGIIFVWLFSTVTSLFLIPVAIAYLVIQTHSVGTLGIVFIVGTSLIHLAYFCCLQRGYQIGVLSVVYPLARGLGPTLATVGAIVLLGERPSFLVLVGLVLVLVGVGLLALKSDERALKNPSKAVFYGVVTGVTIAIYTVWDKYAVSELRVPPLVLEAFAGLGISLMLAPHAIRNWSQVKSKWKETRREVIGVAILAPLSYILVLTAMSFTPLSYVAPAREVSILFAAVLGSHFLGEGQTTRRVLAAVSVVCGVIALAIG